MLIPPDEKIHLNRHAETEGAAFARAAHARRPASHGRLISVSRRVTSAGARRPLKAASRLGKHVRSLTLASEVALWIKVMTLLRSMVAFLISRRMTAASSCAATRRE